MGYQCRIQSAKLLAFLTGCIVCSTAHESAATSMHQSSQRRNSARFVTRSGSSAPLDWIASEETPGTVGVGEAPEVMGKVYNFTSGKLDAQLMQDWVRVIGDWLEPFANGIARHDIEEAWSNPGWHIRFQHVKGKLYLYDPNGFCEEGGGASGYAFMKHRCAALTEILLATKNTDVTGVTWLPDFDLVYSLDDMPPFNSHPGLLDRRPAAAFGCVRCWQKGFMSFPMYGSHEDWRLSKLDSYINGILERTPRPFEQRKSQVVFRGGVERGCSFAPDVDDHLNWTLEPFFGPRTESCGRKLLKDVASRSGGLVDFDTDKLSMSEQENQFKYMISVEGNGGWADRLSALMFYDVGLMVQEHPCPEWFEHQFKPFVHYIPVSNNFDNVIGRLKWAERHPRTVRKMIADRKAIANRVLRHKGLMTFTATLLAMFGQRFDYEIEPMPDSKVVE